MTNLFSMALLESSGMETLFIVLVITVCLAVVVLMIVAFWTVFEKAGKPGWACLIPFYNMWVLCEIGGRPGWWMFLMFIPLVGFIISIVVQVGVAERFGKGVGYALGLIFLGFIFYPMLAWGDAVYTPRLA